MMGGWYSAFRELINICMKFGGGGIEAFGGGTSLLLMIVTDELAFPMLIDASGKVWMVDQEDI
jgi:hypothetical protein